MDEVRETVGTSQRARFRHLATPFVSILVIGVFLVVALVVIAARSQDDVAVAASVHLTRSVLGEMRRVLARLALEYSYWDQAVDNLVTTVDADWADENIGAYSHETYGVAETYVLDEGDRVRYSALDGERVAIDPWSRFSDGFDVLVARARAAPKGVRPRPALGLLRGGGGIQMVAASSLTDYRKVGDALVDRTTTSVLVFAMSLDDERLNAWAESYLLDGLRLSASPPPALFASLPLTAVDGSSLGFLSWRVKRPGDEMLAWLLPTIGVAFVLTGFIAFLFFRRAQTIVVAQARDIEARRRIEAALWESQRRLQDFAADAAHELRTPLAVMRSSLDAMEDQGAAESLRRDLEEMARLVEQLLTEARLDSLDIKPTDEADLHAVCVEVAVQLGPLAIEENKTVEMVGDDLPVIIRGNAEALKHAVRNLVENAIRFTAAGTAVTIAVRDDASVSVVDHGPGVPPDMRDKVFQRFARSNQKAGGAGLGLSIVRRTVEAHGGTVEIAEGPEGGAEFVLQFPHAEAASATGRAAP